MASVKYLGHASLRFTTLSKKVIYLDPYAGDDYSLSPDLVLVTHEHYDHNNLSLLKMKDSTVIIRAKNCFDEQGRYRVFSDGEIKVTSCPAANKNHSIKECVGFILEFDNLKIYCAGDTSYLPFMKDYLPSLKLDYAFLPCDGIYNMDVNQASEVAKIINARHVIPIHMWPGALFSEEVAQKFSCLNKLVLHPGEEINLD